MYTIREGIEKIRSLASAWLTDQTTDGSTAMGEVAATLLNTNFEDPPLHTITMREQSSEEMAAEIELLLRRIETAKHIGVAACDQVIATCQEQTPALRDVAAERLRQVSVEGRSPEEDAQYTNGELADAAGCYAMHADETPEDLEAEGIPAFWPWEAEWWKPTDRRRNLVKAGALILAEIERLDRLSAAKPAELYTAADEARMDVVGQNGPTGEHYEALPMGLTWEKAPEWATALVEADPGNTSIPDRLLVWVPAINQSVDGELAIESMGRKAGKRQHVTMDHPASVWTVVATRPAPIGDGWIEWTGEICPVEDLNAMIWVRLEGDRPTKFGRPGFASGWDWRTEPAMGRSRIVAYRLTDPAS